MIFRRKPWLTEQSPLRKSFSHNSGDDLAGIVHSVGAGVYEFKPGDRVAAYHVTGSENGSFAEYSVAPDWTTFHLGNDVSFEEAATVPIAGFTAAIALYVDLGLRAPWQTTSDASLEQGDAKRDKVPILIYGVSSAVGAFAAKFARLSGYGPIIGVAGRAKEFAQSLSDYVSHPTPISFFLAKFFFQVVDYRNGEENLVTAVEEILAKENLPPRLPYILDAISESGSLEVTLRLLDPLVGSISTVLPPSLFALDKENFEYPPGVKATNSAVPRVHTTHKDFGHLWARCMGRYLEDGRLKGHPFEIAPGGLNGVLTALRKLMDGKASGVKYISMVDETGRVDAGEYYVKKSVAQLPISTFPFPSEN